MIYQAAAAASPAPPTLLLCGHQPQTAVCKREHLRELLFLQQASVLDSYTYRYCRILVASASPGSSIRGQHHSNRFHPAQSVADCQHVRPCRANASCSKGGMRCCCEAADAPQTESCGNLVIADCLHIDNNWCLGCSSSQQPHKTMEVQLRVSLNSSIIYL